MEMQKKHNRLAIGILFVIVAVLATIFLCAVVNSRAVTADESLRRQIADLEARVSTIEERLAIPQQQPVKCCKYDMAVKLVVHAQCDLGWTEVAFTECQGNAGTER